jgi:DNA invertase Pin-like site-specific DNA recombinase
VRVSRVGKRKGESFISPDEQRSKIEQWARLRGVEIGHWETDLDQSGGTQQRPGFRRIMERIESGATDGIVVAKLDRFARTVWEAGADILAIRAAQGHLASVEEAIDPTTPFGEFALIVLLAVAKLERDQRVLGWQSAKERALIRGAHIGPTPLGMHRIEDGPDAGRLRPDPGWNEIMQAVFEQAAVIRSHSGLAAWLNQHHPRPDGRAWTGPTLRNVLRNRVYRGEVNHVARDGTQLGNPQAHEPVVTEEQWQAAQRAPGEQFRRAGPASVLAGLVRCAACRHRMSPGPGGSDGKTRVYRCTRTHATGRCPQPSVIVAANLEKFVLERVRATLRDRAYRGRKVDESQDIERLAERLRATQDELTRYMAATQLPRSVGEEAWLAGVTARTAERDQARVVYQEATAARSGNHEVLFRVQDLDRLDREELAELYAALLDAVFVRRTKRGADLADRLCLLWRGDGPSDLPGKGRGNVGELRPFVWPSTSKA